MISRHSTTNSRPRTPSTPPEVKGGLPWLGHMFNFAKNPYHFVQQAADQTGEIAAFTLLGQKIILLTGDEASELFYRSSDDMLDQSAAYKLMTPIFGEGVIFDAPVARKNEQLKMLMPSLRMDAMRQHSTKIVQEVEEIIKNWGERGDIDLVSFMKRVTINTASHCLLGKEFRYELNDEFADIYHDLEQGINPLAYHFPNLPIPSFKRRNKARKRLQALVGHIIEKRKKQTDKPSDMFQSLIDMRYEDGTKLSSYEITGLLIGAIFAGHHTSSGTSAWVLIELLKHPHLMRDVRQELDELLGSDGEVTFQNLREMPVLENVIKEVLRLHPPLIILMRQVKQDLHFKDYTIKAGDMVWASPPVTHRNSKLFSNPSAFDPDRFSNERCEDKNLMAYQPFGGGKHKCSGNAFALFQIKAIFSILLRRYDFELSESADSYVDDYREMIVQPKSPCRVRFNRRSTDSFKSRFGKSTRQENSQCPFQEQASTDITHAAKVIVDTGLCQGHAACMGEAPKNFRVDHAGKLHILDKHVTAENKEQIEKAIQYCPNQALSIIEH
jgi:sterol 14-demethylase